MTPHRPFGITILAILAGVAMVIAGIHTLQYLHLLPFFLGNMAFFGFDLWGAILWGFMTFLYAWILTQLWTVNPQGWMFLVLLASLNLILAFVSILGETTFQAVLPAIVFNAIVLGYCLMPGVRRAFGTDAAVAA